MTNVFGGVFLIENLKILLTVNCFAVLYCNKCGPIETLQKIVDCLFIVLLPIRKY